MSKKNRVSSKVKKDVPKKKLVKKVTAKKTKAVDKPVKKMKAKKVVLKKITKPAAKKKIAKKPVKKVIKQVKKIAAKKKPVVKKKLVKKAIKKAAPKKAVAKKLAASPKKVGSKSPVKQAAKKVMVAKKTPTQPIAKPVKEIPKAIKPSPAPKGTPKPKPQAKPIVMPATYRKPDNIPSHTKALKEPAGKFEIEFVIRSSAEMLYEFLSSPSGLSEWFCDDVNIRNGIYSFVWEGQEQQAQLVKDTENLVRFQWIEKNDGSYFEFRIQKDELTNDISLMITDFAGDKKEEESIKLLWKSQIDKLLHVLGAYF